MISLGEQAPHSQSDTWVALDFETAMPARASACALGVAVIRNDLIISSDSWLIQPPGNEYDPMNTYVHGIDSSHTISAPTFDELYPELLPLLDNRYILAHWASFDVSVLRAIHEYYGIPLPDAHYACSCRMARATFPDLPNHQLPTVCAHCGISLDHHDAASDALACAEVALHCCDTIGAGSIHDAIDSLGLDVRSVCR